MSGNDGTEVTNRFQQVTSFINSDNDPDFTGATWMLIANWYNAHPDPHGDSAEQDRQDPYLQSVSNAYIYYIKKAALQFDSHSYIRIKLVDFNLTSSSKYQ